jgi:hypothetical protein
MFHRDLKRLALTGLLVLAPLHGAEDNVWPLYVRQEQPTGVAEQAIGPLIFAQSGPDDRRFGLRPVYSKSVAPGLEETTLLYPFFVWREQPDYRTFSFFQLINRRVDETGAGPADHRFDVWPFWFSRDAGDPATSYRALFPFAGTIKNRFGRDQITFAAFPLYARTEKAGRVVTHAPWPIVRAHNGDGHEGFEVWPLYGRVARAGDYTRQFWLWPLGYHSARNLSTPQPDVKLGLLPFYARDTGPGYINENYAWPFFGYSDRTEPYRYHETRWLWPFLVQGEGEERRVNRWAPFYTHSVIKGTDKTWLLWPLLRHQAWQADGLAQEKTQLLYFFYWSLEQRSPDRPTAPSAYRRHLWPLLSTWDNGAGHRQVQALSPFEVFFPGNDQIRRLWSPLFAVYRYERKPDASESHALLWRAVTWRRGAAEREFNLGPIASFHATGSERRLTLGRGLVGLRRAADGRWRAFAFDFSSPAALKPTSP